MANHSTSRAKVAVINLGKNFSFQGLMLPDGSYAVAVSQIARLFQFDRSQATRKIKRALGEDFQLVKVASELNPKKVNYLTLEQFEKLALRLGISGNVDAQDFLELTTGGFLRQRYADAFGERFEAEERDQWVKNRQHGKETRRTLTDSIRDYILRHPDMSETRQKWLYKHVSDKAHKLLFGGTAKQIATNLDVEPEKLRDTLGSRDLINLEILESVASNLIDQQDVYPVDAIVEAGDRTLLGCN